MTDIDQRAFRDAMSLFASGVTVIAADDGAEAHAMTAASFASVSLEPPLGLVCVSLRSPLLPILRRAGRFAVHILAADQAETALLCASGPHDQRRALLDRAPGPRPERAPILPGALARFEMALHAEHPGGDHAVVLGRVLAITAVDRETAPAPLSWWRGQLGALAPRPER